MGLKYEGGTVLSYCHSVRCRCWTEHFWGIIVPQMFLLFEKRQGGGGEKSDDSRVGQPSNRAIGIMETINTSVTVHVAGARHFYMKILLRVQKACTFIVMLMVTRSTINCCDGSFTTPHPFFKRITTFSSNRTLSLIDDHGLKSRKMKLM